MSSTFTKEQRESAESEIYEERLGYDYDTKEYPIEVIEKRYRERRILVSANGDPAKTLWSSAAQSRFIESLILSHPVLPLVFAKIRDDERIRVVDGNQRVLAIVKFATNQLELTGLTKLPLLEGFKFADLQISRQRRFNRISLRAIVFSEKTTQEYIDDYRDRINTDATLR